MAVIKADARDEFGTRNAKRLREQGKIPAIIYGHGEPAQAVTLSEREIELAVLHGERLLEVDLGNAKQNVLIKELQYDTFGQEILHVDLTRVSLDERVEVTVPIVLRGTPAGAAEEGVLQQLAPEVRVECVVTAIPDEIRVAVGELQIGDAIHMSELELPDGATLLEEPETLVCNVVLIAEEVVVEEGEEEPGEGEPEVIGEKVEPQDEAEGEKPAE